MGQIEVTIRSSASEAESRESRLIASVKAGETEKFYELVQPYERRVYAAALAILKNPADAEDAVQEAMIKALAGLGQFRAEARFSTWLIQIAVNESLMFRRRKKTVVMEPMEARTDHDEVYTPRDFSDWREIPSEVLERKQVRKHLERALDQLDQKYREVFILRDVEHLSIQDTAETLGISIASVKTRLLRARLMLRDQLSEGWNNGWFSRLPFAKGTNPW